MLCRWTYKVFSEVCRKKFTKDFLKNTVNKIFFYYFKAKFSVLPFVQYPVTAGSVFCFIFWGRIGLHKALR